MSLSFRPQGSNGPMYSPERDWSCCLPKLLSTVVRLFKADLWPVAYDTVAAAMGDTTGELASAELTKANDAYVQFVKLCTQDSKQTCEQVLKESGFLDVHPAAQVGYLAMLAQVFTGNLYSGLRDVTQEGTVSDAAQSVEKLYRAGFDARRLLNSMTEADDLKIGLAEILTLLRNEGTQWNVIDLIVKRSKALEGDSTAV